MAHHAFDEFIEQQAKASERAAESWTRRLHDWPGELATLYGQTDGFLDRYVQAGQVRITPGRKAVSEELVGQYEAETRTIELGGTVVTLDPVGVNVVGARGRVDMVGPYGEVMILLVDAAASRPRIRIVRDPESGGNKPAAAAEWAWKLVTHPPDMVFIELSEEAFLDALLEVANG